MRPPENSSALTAEQCQIILEHVGPMLLYLRKLLNRIDQLHFPADDALRREVTEAYNAMHNLRVGLHYMTCNAMKREKAVKPQASPTGNYELYRKKRKG